MGNMLTHLFKETGYPFLDHLYLGVEMPLHGLDHFIYQMIASKPLLPFHDADDGCIEGVSTITFDVSVNRLALFGLHEHPSMVLLGKIEPAYRFLMCQTWNMYVSLGIRKFVVEIEDVSFVHVSPRRRF